MIDVRTSRVASQRGAALILIVFILAIVVTTYILKAINTQTIQVDHQQRVRERLNEAKQALIGWAVANKDYPGQMPYPDRLEVVNPIYDGGSDCAGSNPLNNYSLLIGQLALYGSDGCLSFKESEGLGVNVDDGYGNNFWYAVSPNLLHNYAPTGAQLSDPVINSDTMDAATWLKVLDQNGNLVSDRVAAVIIAPGDAIGNQSRSNTATTDNYLDSFQKNGNIYSNVDYDEIDEDFVMGLPASTIDDNDVSYTQPYLFNDQLVYITIDELMVALEKRVARQVVASLNDYYINSNANPGDRYYPFAAVYEFPSGAACIDTQLFGQLPLSDCGTQGISTFLPAWFTQSAWEKVFFYTLSSDCSIDTPGCDTNFGKLVVGSNASVNALVVTTGAALAGQTRPTAVPSDYLEGQNANVGADLIFDAVGTPLTNTYNDQMFIVAP